jgi:hypothetical protein
VRDGCQEPHRQSALDYEGTGVSMKIGSEALPGLSQNIIALTIAAWNKAVLPAEMQEGFDQKVLHALGPMSDSREGREVIAYTMNLIAGRRRKYYPHLRRYIVSFAFGPSEGMFILNVASAPIPS